MRSDLKGDLNGQQTDHSGLHSTTNPSKRCKASCHFSVEVPPQRRPKQNPHGTDTLAASSRSSLAGQRSGVQGRILHLLSGRDPPCEHHFYSPGCVAPTGEEELPIEVPPPARVRVKMLAFTFLVLLFAGSLLSLAGSNQSLQARSHVLSHGRATNKMCKADLRVEVQPSL